MVLFAKEVEAIVEDMKQTMQLDGAGVIIPLEIAGLSLPLALEGAGVIVDDAGVIVDCAGVIVDGAGVIVNGPGVIVNGAGVILPLEGAGFGLPLKCTKLLDEKKILVQVPAVDILVESFKEPEKLKAEHVKITRSSDDEVESINGDEVGVEGCNSEEKDVDNPISDDGYCSSEQCQCCAEHQYSVDNSEDDRIESWSTTQSAYCTESWEVKLEGCEERSFEIKKVPGKGNGMFATKRIYPGEIILREIPLLIVTDEIYNDQDKCERYLDRIVEKMPMHDRRRFLSLTDGRNCSGPTYLGRFYTNDMDWDGDVCLCPTMARANHSCRPNTDFYTRQDLGEQRLVAISVIEKGAEITISYLPSADEGTDIRSRRQAYLRSFWGFQCTCLECTLQDEELEVNEAIREEIKEIQSGGLENLLPYELERLLSLCVEVSVKPYYLLLVIETLYTKHQDLAEKLFQSVRGLGAAIHSYGEDSVVARKWLERLQLDEFSAMQF
jgi:hypothetical protein